MRENMDGNFQPVIFAFEIFQKLSHLEELILHYVSILLIA